MASRMMLPHIYIAPSARVILVSAPQYITVATAYVDSTDTL